MKVISIVFGLIFAVQNIWIAGMIFFIGPAGEWSWAWTTLIVLLLASGLIVPCVVISTSVKDEK